MHLVFERQVSGESAYICYIIVIIKLHKGVHRCDEERRAVRVFPDEIGLLCRIHRECATDGTAVCKAVVHKHTLDTQVNFKMIVKKCRVEIQ